VPLREAAPPTSAAPGGCGDLVRNPHFARGNRHRERKRPLRQGATSLGTRRDIQNFAHCHSGCPLSFAWVSPYPKDGWIKHRAHQAGRRFHARTRTSLSTAVSSRHCADRFRHCQDQGQVKQCSGGTPKPRSGNASRAMRCDAMQPGATWRNPARRDAPDAKRTQCPRAAPASWSRAVPAVSLSNRPRPGMSENVRRCPISAEIAPSLSYGARKEVRDRGSGDDTVRGWQVQR
jgi:hypothetical protein